VSGDGLLVLATVNNKLTVFSDIIGKVFYFVLPRTVQIPPEWLVDGRLRCVRFVARFSLTHNNGTVCARRCCQATYDVPQTRRGC
jgi:hypothetical protein